FSIPTEQQIVHKHKQVDKKRSQGEALVPLTSGLGFDEREKEDAPGQPLTNQLPLVKSNSGALSLDPSYSRDNAPATESKALFVGPSKTLKKNKEQSLVSSQAKTVRAPIYIDIPTSHSRKPTRDKAIGDKHFTAFNKSKGLDAYTEQARGKRKQARELDNVALTLTLALEQLTIAHSYIANGGHQIQLKKQDDAWMAIVREHAPVGFSRTHYLKVYLAPGFTVSNLSKYSTEWQENHIRVIFPEKIPSGKGYVYIGKVGLLGGGKTKSSKNKDEQNGCNFGPDARRLDPDNPSKWVCPG
ncbi:hypothetical protein GR268_42590, partial [Rhizobium leguminosarum]|nr:hypothetical protein [Rhizobium leguminosarum]